MDVIHFRDIVGHGYGDFINTEKDIECAKAQEDPRNPRPQPLI